MDACHHVRVEIFAFAMRSFVHGADEAQRRGRSGGLRFCLPLLQKRKISWKSGWF